MKKLLAWFLVFSLMFVQMPKLRADDSDIFGQNIQPNVMIFLDTSGSMNDEIGTPIAYNPNTTYCQPATSDCPYGYTSTVVYKKSNSSYTQYAVDVAHVIDSKDATITAAAQNSLNTTGQWNGKINKSNVQLSTGNYRNYFKCGSCDGVEPKIVIAKRVITNLLQGTQGVRFGLMRFENSSQQNNPAGSGKMVAEIGTNVTTMVNALNAMTASGYTPLGEAATDVNRYFGGNTLIDGTTYSSPIQYSCQPNFAIMITDGMWNGNIDPQPVATTLFTTDHSSSLSGKQNVVVDTVGFNLTGSDLQAVPVLQTMAKNGGGNFYTANNSVQLEQALENAIEQVLAATFSFATPVIPTTGISGTGRAYLAAFQSNPASRFWDGFLKAYTLDSNGLIPVDSQGLPTSPPVWDAGAMLSTLASSSRTIYTVVSGARQSFTKSNSAITQALLGVSTSSDHDKIIDFIRGVDAYDQNLNGNTTEDRAWKLGDIFHSTPALVTKPTAVSLDATYNTFKTNNAGRTTVLVAGANDGMLHAFRESDGVELWGFIPGDLLPQLQQLTVNSGNHMYYVDSSPIVADICTSSTTDGSGKCGSASSWKTIAVVGERRGGKNYLALDITDTTNPLYLWSFTDSKINETWSEPSIGKVKMSDGSAKWVAFVGGGFDTAQNNNLGKAVFAIDLTNGNKLWEYYASGPTDDRKYMNFSLAANPIALDLDSDGFVDHVYIADVGGQVWKFNVAPSGGTTLSGGLANNWTGRRLFTADPSQANPPAAGEYYPNQGMYVTPALAYDTSHNLWIFFGSGDRDHPNSGSSNRFYGFKDDPTNMTNGSNLTESSLVDTTSGTGTVSQGWFITLASSEKDLASATVFNGAVLFTTFTPTTVVACGSGGGDAKLYSVNMGSGDAALNLADGTPLSAHQSASANATAIGTGIPSKPIIVLPNSAVTDTTNQNLHVAKVQSTPQKQLVGWREVF